MSKEHPIFWHNVHHGLFLLEKTLRDVNFIPDVIVAVGRGGLVPGTLFAYRFNIKRVLNYSVQSYNDREQGDTIQVIQEPNNNMLEYKDKNVLIFDDLSDTGNTLQYITDRLKKDFGITNVKTATLCIKKHANFIPDFYVQVYPSDTWLVFPWEVGEV